jgi:hypothetical protein
MPHVRTHRSLPERDHPRRAGYARAVLEVGRRHASWFEPRSATTGHTGILRWHARPTGRRPPTGSRQPVDPSSSRGQAAHRISSQHDSAGFNLATSRQLILTARSRTWIPRHQLVADSHAFWPRIPCDFSHPHPCKQRHSTPEGGVRNKCLHAIDPRLPLCSRESSIASSYASCAASFPMENRLRRTLQTPRAFRSSDSNPDSLPAGPAHGRISPG